MSNKTVKLLRDLKSISLRVSERQQVIMQQQSNIERLLAQGDETLAELAISLAEREDPVCCGG